MVKAKNDNKKISTEKLPPIFFSAIFALISFYTITSIISRIHSASNKSNINYFPLLCAVLFFSCLFIALIIFRKKLINKYTKTTFSYFLFATAGLIISFLALIKLFSISSPVLSLAEHEKIESIECMLTSEPFPAGRKYYKASAKILSCTYNSQYKQARFSASGNINIFIPKEMITQNNAFAISRYKSKNKNACKNFSKGIIISAKGRLTRKKSLLEKNAFFVGKEIPLFIKWQSPLKRFRASLRFKLMRLLAAWGNAGGLLLALLSANKDFLQKTCIQIFRRTGLAHILALSGMHVSLLAIMAVQVGSIFGKKSRAVSFSLVTIILFVWFAGSAPSLNRALTMMLILIIGKSLGLKPSLLVVLSATVLLHILISPEDALTMGFMLSYGALTGIISIGKAFYSILNGKVPTRSLSGISASIGAQLFTTPLLIFKLGIIAPVGILASVVISPIVSLFLILGIISVIVALIFPSIGFIFSFILNTLYDLMITLSTGFSYFPILQAHNTTMKVIFSLLAIFISIYIIIYAKGLKKKRLCIY